MKWANQILSKEERLLLKTILDELSKSSKTETIYPPAKNVFRALENLDSVKVVILGQDPYHGEGQANGFAFAVNQGTTKPPSLLNIFKELKSDIGEYQVDQTLEHWANQGVLLLNSSLTVLAGKAGSHSNIGWHKITNRIVKHLSDTRENLVFILWGKHAQAKASIIDDERHCVIMSAHPSPLSAHSGFFNSRPFSKTNEYLISKQLKPIIW